MAELCPTCGSAVDVVSGDEGTSYYESRADDYRAALEEIARHPLVERNPDGEDQAAHTMRLIAREALAASKEETHGAS